MTEFIKRVSGTLRIIYAQNPDALALIDKLEGGGLLTIYDKNDPAQKLHAEVWGKFPEKVRIENYNPSIFGGVVRCLMLVPEPPTSQPLYTGR